jgi:hypothetical protein
VGETWSLLLLSRGALAALLQMLGQASQLSALRPAALLAPPPAPCPTQDCYHLSTLSPWHLTLLVQSEALLSLGAYASSHGREALGQLRSAPARAALGPLLAMDDVMASTSGSPLREAAGPRAQRLAWRRTEACLELLRAALRAAGGLGPTPTSTTSFTSPRSTPRAAPSDPFQDLLSTFTCVPRLLAHTHALFGEDTGRPPPGASPPPAHLCALECPCRVSPPFCHFDLWPWHEWRGADSWSVAMAALPPRSGRHLSHAESLARTTSDAESLDDSGLLRDPALTYRLADAALAAEGFRFELARWEEMGEGSLGRRAVLSSLCGHLLQVRVVGLCEVSTPPV